MSIGELERFYRVVDTFIDEFGAMEEFMTEYRLRKQQIADVIFCEFEVKSLRDLPAVYNIPPTAKSLVEELRKWIVENYRFPR